LAKLRSKLSGRDLALGLATAAVPTPVGVSSAAVRSAMAFQIASGSVPRGVAALTLGVLRMFWLRKVTTAGLTAAVILAAGVGIGLSVRQTSQSIAQEVPQVKEPNPAANADSYAVLTVRGTDNGRPPYALTEYSADGTVRWGVTLGVTADQGQPANALMLIRDGKLRGGVVDATRAYLTRVRNDPNAPKELRVVFENDAPIGVYPQEALRCCVDAGFVKITFTGYVPCGGFIPQLAPGADGEAVGYKRYEGEVVESKKLFEEYSKAITSW
jgi:hypothetical protein